MTSTLVLSSAFVALATLYYLKSKRIQNHPPLFKSTSFFSFVLGALPDIIHFQSKQALPDFFVQLNKSDLLCLLEIPGKTIISVARPDVIKSVLTRQNDFKRDALLQNMFQGIGTWSLFVIPTNDVWFRHRKLLQPAFGPTHLKYGFECTNLCFNVLAKSWHGLLKNNSVTVDIHKHLACMTLDIMYFNLNKVERLLSLMNSI